MSNANPAPPPIHWFARILAFLLAAIGAGAMLFALWALTFDPKGDRVELLSLIPLGLLLAGTCGWIALLGRVGPKPNMDLDAPAPKAPWPVRWRAASVCLLSPAIPWALIRQSGVPQGWHGWLNVALTAAFAIYAIVALARLAIGGYWPQSSLRFALRANMGWREQLADARREQEHAAGNTREF